jgi:hypothetical protein
MTQKNTNEQTETFEELYKRERIMQLKESEDFESLANKVAEYELELLDYADRLLSDTPITMDSMTAYGTLDLVGSDSVKLLKLLDNDKEYRGLAEYY